MKALLPAAAIVLLVTMLPAFAENWADNHDSYTMVPEYARSKAICRSLASMPPLPPTNSTPSQGNRSAENLYYGIGGPPDPEGAWKRALRERTAPDNRAAFSGDIMLMTIYANGVGAPRDLDRAIAIACNLGGAPAEEDGRVKHLAALKAQHWTGHNFSFCDDVTSGYAQGLCAAHDAAIEDGKRKRRLEAMTAGWSQADKRAFLPLQRAKAAYIKAIADNEVDISGTARAAMVINEEQNQQAEFLTILRSLEHGIAPRFTAQDAANADNKLNAVYQKVQHVADTALWGTVTKDGIRTVQRVWQRYRDAWAAFVPVRYPAVTGDSIRTILTEKRTVMLEAFLP